MKVGDKIRAIKTDSMFFRNGDEGIIVLHADDDPEGDYWAVFNDSGLDCCIGPMTPEDEWQFEVIEEAP
jgi:hypothetical protein